MSKLIGWRKSYVQRRNTVGCLDQYTALYSNYTEGGKCPSLPTNGASAEIQESAVKDGLCIYTGGKNRTLISEFDTTVNASQFAIKYLSQNVKN